MRRLWILLPLIAASLVLWSGRGTTAPPNEVGPFMQLKLQHSQKVFEGIVLENYDKIAQNAQELTLLSQAASWQVLQTPEYLQHSSEFRRATEALTKAGREKNLDGAALAYMEVTMKCVNCHKYVRDVRMADRGGAPTLGEIGR